MLSAGAHEDGAPLLELDRLALDLEAGRGVDDLVAAVPGREPLCDVADVEGVRDRPVHS